jgi:hypothetical protein
MRRLDEHIARSLNSQEDSSVWLGRTITAKRKGRRLRAWLYRLIYQICTGREVARGFSVKACRRLEKLREQRDND